MVPRMDNPTLMQTILVIVQILLGVVVTGLGWFLSTLHRDVRDTDRRIAELALAVAREHATKAEVLAIKSEFRDALREAVTEIKTEVRSIRQGAQHA